ncbi:MAG TPA: phenylalanine--tRNA ligase beta subunit-related protein [Candidatus Azoamicus sp. MARI]
MKINLNLIKKWFYENINIENIANKLTDVGFETFIEKNILNISVPNNRHDCTNLLSILNEISKFYKIKKIDTVYLTTNQQNEKIKVYIKEKSFCPIYCYAIIKNINNNKQTPIEIEEHLKLNEINTHNFIIDILNFSTLITGQPLHAYDKNKISKKIFIEKSNKNITTSSINNVNIHIEKNNFIIRDDNNNILSIPGKIGTLSSKVDKNTTSIIIESAYFSEKAFKNSNVNTLSSNIFKYGINLQLIKPSLIYAINLINNIQDSNSYAIIEKICKKYIPKKKIIILKKNYLSKFTNINEINLNDIFEYTGINIKIFKNSWKFTIPSHRKDIEIKENIIADIIKFYGYNEIKELPLINDTTHINKAYFRGKNNDNKTIHFLLSNGFNEIITYSFVDKNIELLITSNDSIINIKNPMSENNNVLRTNLIQGMIKTFKLNINKGNEKIKIFEIGNVYTQNKNKIIVKKKLACMCEENDIITENENYKCNTNFFIIKKLLENIISKIYKNKNIEFEINNKNNYLNENISANVIIKNKKIGEIGLLNNNFLNALSIKNNIYFFQIDLNFNNKENIQIKKISKLPIIKRDISIILKKDETYSNLKKYITKLNINDLKEIKFMNVFEINNSKSINIRLIFQNNKKTLTDNEINSKTFLIIDMIKQKFNVI